MLVTQFTDEEEDSPGEKSGPEYVFEGFNIEFSEKIALTPLTPKRGPVAQGQSIARSFRLEPPVAKPDPKRTEFGPASTEEITKADFDPLKADQDAQDRRNDAQNRITQLAAGSDIARFAWAGRGVAPIGYIKGMALVFTRVFCKFRAGDAAAVEMAKASTGNANNDSLAHFNAEFNAAGMRNNVAGADTLRHLFVLLIGLGMRESSGKYCVGRFSMGNTNGETAEAGLFQTSFNVRNFNPMLMQMFQQLQLIPTSTGLLRVFKEGVAPCTAQDLENVGTGDGQEFQRRSKDYPAFAAEFTAVALRNTSQHWAPIIGKNVQIRTECDTMLKQVQDLVDAQNMCPLL